jgi:hypothetical protein
MSPFVGMAPASFAATGVARIVGNSTQEVANLITAPIGTAA